MRTEPPIRRHPAIPSGDDELCAHCPAPTGNARYHPPITWLTDTDTLDSVRDALTDALASGDDFTLQAQLEQAIGWMAPRYRLVTAASAHELWPTLGFDRPRPLAAGRRAVRHLERIGVLTRARDFTRRPIRVSTTARGHVIDLDAYTTNPQKGHQ